MKNAISELIDMIQRGQDWEERDIELIVLCGKDAYRAIMADVEAMYKGLSQVSWGDLRIYGSPICVSLDVPPAEARLCRVLRRTNIEAAQ